LGPAHSGDAGCCGNRLVIELVAESACIKCDICVRICPTDVFDAVPGAAPIIARKDDCHTCMACELHCPADALYVSPRSDPDPAVDPATIAASGIFGSYARALGWHRGAPGGTDDDPGVLLAFNRAPNPNDKVRMQLYNISQRNYIDVESSQVADV
jgi:NAD-dependent dihydropyrimidine dehydrogenase PreA subunit